MPRSTIPCLFGMAAAERFLVLTRPPTRPNATLTFIPSMPIAGSYFMPRMSIYSFIPKLNEFGVMEESFMRLSTASSSLLSSSLAPLPRSVTNAPILCPFVILNAGLLFLDISSAGLLPVMSSSSLLAAAFCFSSLPLPMFITSLLILTSCIGLGSAISLNYHYIPQEGLELVSGAPVNEDGRRNVRGPRFYLLHCSGFAHVHPLYYYAPASLLKLDYFCAACFKDDRVVRHRVLRGL